MTSHSITGVFDAQYHTAVCEGYAKSFQLLMNAAGVSNFYIVGLGNGGGHAWNMAQMDDGYYYYFDATWDDTAQTSKYFAAGELLVNIADDELRQRLQRDGDQVFA